VFDSNQVTCSVRSANC